MNIAIPIVWIESRIAFRSRDTKLPSRCRGRHCIVSWDLPGAFYIAWDNTSPGGWSGVIATLRSRVVGRNAGGFYFAGRAKYGTRRSAHREFRLRFRLRSADCERRPSGYSPCQYWMSKRKREKYADWTGACDNRCEITFRVARDPREKDKKEDSDGNEDCQEV